MIKEMSKNSEIYTSTMRYFFSRRRDDIVYKFSDETLKIDPKSKDAYYFKSIALSNSKMNEDALKLIEEGLKKFPNDRDLLAQKSGVYLNMQDYEECVKIKKQLLKHHPKDVETMASLAQILQGSLGKKKEAAEWYEKAADHKAKTARTYLLIGDGLTKFQKYDKAAKCFEKASKKDPENAYYLYRRGGAEALRNKDEKALKYLRKAIELEPKRYKEMAKKAEAFKSLRNSSAFKQLVG